MGSGCAGLSVLSLANNDGTAVNDSKAVNNSKAGFFRVAANRNAPGFDDAALCDFHVPAVEHGNGFFV